ncbi:MAG: cation transporting ATPase C-terminal domain-containing protein, partial [Pseudonocardiaceae bacterium]
LVLAYSARRVITSPRMNIALHLTVALCLSLQLLTVFVPGLRVVLGLERPDLLGLVWVVGAIGLSWGAAEGYSRLAIATAWSGSIPILDSESNLRRQSR